MKITHIRTLALRVAVAASLLPCAVVHATPVDFAERGVFRFASSSGCPLSGLDQGRADCNRIAIDMPDTRAAVDTAARTIVFSSDAKHKRDAVVGDVLLQGNGISEEGQRVPLGLHLLLRRTGKKWNVDSYIHAPVRGKFSNVMMDPYKISVLEGERSRTIFTPEQARHMFADPTFAARLARAFVTVQGTDTGNPTTGDITVALGVGKMSKSLLRARFASDKLGSSDELNQTFSNGTWSIELEAMSDHIPLWVVQRELFLFGLETHPALRTVRENGFRSHDTLTFGALNGKGFLRFNGHEAAFEGAPASGYAFMQESFMGLILTWRRQVAMSTASGANPSLKRSQP